MVVNDRRRIDPETGQVRSEAASEQLAAAEAAAEATPAPEADAGALAEVRKQLEERTADLQRLQAEYANYRKRVDRDREVVVHNAKATVVTELLSVLDDFERAERHGDLTGAFKAVADKVVATLQKAGLEAFGHHGEEFDPSVHEAVQHDTSPEVSGPTVTAVLRRGFRFGERVLRPAMVGVTDHEPGAASAEEATGRHAAPEPQANGESQQ
ncbi:molecular chaperone GrpE [Crossiella equi]|uniref:Protein GrpE n=1 Tax=Crossiella equi TaxID=130796 RepID=A0ABS5AHH2_9PSEU|nr:nucleotide exchange factor GrpE [Crossiella equi]MBP2475742.1 molecular chaperone GrpE [Crossiella equi]